MRLYTVWFRAAQCQLRVSLRVRHIYVTVTSQNRGSYDLSLPSRAVCLHAGSEESFSKITCFSLCEVRLIMQPRFLYQTLSAVRYRT